MLVGNSFTRMPGSRWLFVFSALLALIATPADASDSKAFVEAAPLNVESVQGVNPSDTHRIAAVEEKAGYLTKGSMNFSVLGTFYSEAWGFNGSKENLYGGVVSFGYFFLNKLSLNAEMTFMAVEQYSGNTFLGGISLVFRWHYFTIERFSLFMDAGFGVSGAGDRVPPPSGTNFNFLIHAGLGTTYKLSKHLCLFGNFRYFHLSNGSVFGTDRNPDIDALGGQLGVMILL